MEKKILNIRYEETSQPMLEIKEEKCSHQMLDLKTLLQQGYSRKLPYN